MMNNKKMAITKIVLLSIIALLLTGILIVLLVKNPIKLKSKVQNKVTEKELTETIKNITIKSKTSDIYIKRSQTDKISYRYNGKENTDLNIEINNETLNIADSDDHFCIGYCKKNRIEIFIPENQFGNLDIETNDSDIKILDQISMITTIKTTSGDVKVSNIADLTVETNNGDIEVNEVKNTNIFTRSGDVELNNITDFCKIETTSGDVEITNLNLSKNSTIKTTSGSVEITRNDHVYINAQTTNGEVEVFNNNQGSTIELLIETTSGDIESNSD